MPPAARVGDTTAHGGTITGPGVATVLIGGMPASVVGDLHVCAIPPPTPHPTTTPFTAGSSKVMVGGRPLVRVGDVCGCGATPVVGAPTVMAG